MTTLTPLVIRYLEGRRRRGEIKQKTVKNLAARLDSFDASFGNRPLAQLGQAAVERWLESIGELAPATRRAYLSTVKVFCRWLVKERIITTDPARDVPKIREPRAVPRALPAAHVSQVMATLPDLRAHAIVWLMVGLGLRRAEVADLEVGDYDPVAATVTVTGKNDDQRVVPVPPEAAAALNAYLRSVGARYGPLIRSKTILNAALSPETVGKMVSDWMRDAGVKHAPRDGVSGHAFRHTAASDVLDRCHDLRVVQQMLGHRHLSSTAIYLRRADLGQIREAMKGRTYGTTLGATVGVAKGAGSDGPDDGDTAVDPADLPVELEPNAHVDNLIVVCDPPVADPETGGFDLVPAVTNEKYAPDGRHIRSQLHVNTS